jgi:hypothetical protein
MKKKMLFNIVFVVGLVLYALSFIATKKVFPEDPCYATAIFWFQKDSIRNNYHQLYNMNDTLLIRADTLYPVNWNQVCDTLCSIYKDSCNRTGTPILVVNWRDTARSTWNTQYGRTILFRKCP